MKKPAPRKTRRSVDRTSSDRQAAHLVRLVEAKGKRLMVDLDAEARVALEALRADGYADTMVAVVRRALVEANDARARRRRK